MEPFTIVIFILGLVFLIGSCFLPEKKPEENNEEILKKLARRELSEEEKENIRMAVNQIISEKTEEVINKTDDYLSKVANEKIMAVDEFSKQIMARLDKNNSDAMFLYNMLNEARDEMKQTLSDVRLAEEKKSEDKSEELPKKDGEVFHGHEVFIKPETVLTLKRDPDFSDFAFTLTEEEKNKDIQKEQIISLHKQGKSIRDISRELSMGQGEVKLVIELYGT